MPQQTSPGKVRFELTKEELEANIQFLSDQIFRVKHIDPKIPGNRSNYDQIKVAESALAVLQDAVKTPRPTHTTEVQAPKKVDQPDFHRPLQAHRAKRG